MIQIEIKETKVRVIVDTKYPIESRYVFSFDTGNADFAALLAENMNEKMRNDLEKIRRDTYEQGWKDAKAKKAKERYFSRMWL